MRAIRGAVVVLVLLASGCGGAGAPGATVTVSATVTEQVVATATVTPTPTPLALGDDGDTAAFVAAYNQIMGGDDVLTDETVIDLGWNLCRVAEQQSDEAAAGYLLGAPSKGVAVMAAARAHLCP